MSKPKLVIYSQKLPDCPCFNTLFNTEFEAEATDREENFITSIRRANVDAAVVCFCSSSQKHAKELLRLDALIGPVPVLTCSKTRNPAFIKFATQHGVDHFIFCDMGKGEIQDIVFETMRRGGLKQFLESCCPGSVLSSPHIPKMIDEIIHTFPSRLEESEMAQRLGISQSWLLKLCRQAFGKTFVGLVRHIRVYQALHMMLRTDFDNGEIALQLNFSEESNMARDFRKELGYNPTEARRLLAHHTPEELMLS